jgi:TRAP-type C4-dicarboxylate transport system permease small subunit
MRHSALDALPPKVQASLAVIIIVCALAYALVRGRAFLPFQPTRGRSPILFYLAIVFLAVILIISIWEVLRS